MRRGLNADHGHQPAQAQALYRRALRIAHQMLLTGPASEEDSCDDRVAAFVVTHLNLADSLAQGGQDDAAASCLCAAHRALVSLLRDEAAPAALRSAARRHLRESHAALLGHFRRHGGPPEVAAALRSGHGPVPGLTH